MASRTEAAAMLVLGTMKEREMGMRGKMRWAWLVVGIVGLAALVASLAGTHANADPAGKPPTPEPSQPTKLVFPVHGFSIEPLEARANHRYVIVSMTLPPTDKFAANVSVEVQPYAGNIDGYAAISKGQFEAAGLTLLKEIRNDDSLIWAYRGNVQGRDLQWYAKAMFVDGKVYLAVATATEKQWETLGNRLQTVVDSFALEDLAD